MTQESGLVNKEVAARMLAVSKRTIENLVRDGVLAPVRVRGAVRFENAEISRYISSQRGRRP